MNTLRTLLISPDHHMVHTIRTSTFDELQDPSTVPSNVSIESTVGVTPGQLVVERHWAHANRLRLCFAADPTNIVGRVYSTYDFNSSLEREKFIAIVNHMAVVSASMPRSVSSQPLAAIPRLAPVESAVGLWGQKWPRTEVNLCVCKQLRGPACAALSPSVCTELCVSSLSFWWRFRFLERGGDWPPWRHQRVHLPAVRVGRAV